MSRRTIALALLRRAETAADKLEAAEFVGPKEVAWKITHKTRDAFIDEWLDRQLPRHMERVLNLEDRIADIESAHNVKTAKWYVVTLAPEHDSDPFALLAWAERFSARAPVGEVLWSIEQKGSTPETMGHHPHIHMAFRRKADAKAWRSKAEVLRDALSSARAVGLTVADNCCDVKSGVANGRDWFTRYCVNYESKDGHKEPTRAYDALWRVALGVPSHFDSDPPAAVGASLAMVP